MLLKSVRHIRRTLSWVKDDENYAYSLSRYFWSRGRIQWWKRRRGTGGEGERRWAWRHRPQCPDTAGTFMWLPRVNANWIMISAVQAIRKMTNICKRVRLMNCFHRFSKGNDKIDPSDSRTALSIWQRFRRRVFFLVGNWLLAQTIASVTLQ